MKDNGLWWANPERKKRFLERMNTNNPMWKGDDVKNNGLHWWVKNHLSKPQLCEICNNKSPYDLANITGVYSRDFGNWKYLCRSCHMKSDGRIQALIQSTRKDFSERFCSICMNQNTRIRKSGSPLWYKDEKGDGWLCDKCYFRLLYRDKSTDRSISYEQNL